MTYQIQYFVKYAQESQLTYTISGVGVWEGVVGQMTSTTSWPYAESVTSITEIKSTT
jgi:hypothetical protein